MFGVYLHICTWVGWIGKCKGTIFPVMKDTTSLK